MNRKERRTHLKILNKTLVFVRSGDDSYAASQNSSKPLPIDCSHSKFFHANLDIHQLFYRQPALPPHHDQACHPKLFTHAAYSLDRAAVQSVHMPLWWSGWHSPFRGSRPSCPKRLCDRSSSSARVGLADRIP
jgi:hypothetical protein